MKNEPQRTSAGRLELRFIKKTGDLCDGMRVSEAIQYIWEDCQKKKQLRSECKRSSAFENGKRPRFHRGKLSYINGELYQA